MTPRNADHMRLMLALLLVIVGAEIFDISVNKTYVFISSSQFSISWNILAFVSVAIIYIVSQHFILKFVKRSNVNNIKTKDRLHFFLVHNIVRIIQYALISILAVVTLQMTATSVYNVHFLISSIWLSYGLAICMLGFLIWRFFYWFMTNRNVVVFLYGLAMTFIATSAGISLILSTLLIVGQPMDVGQIASLTEASMPDNLIGLNNSLIVSSVIAFILTWVSTVLVLRHYSKAVGRTKYWIIVSLPLVYFLTQFQPFLYLFSSYSLEQPFLFATIYTIIFSASKPAGGVLFAAAFWTIAKKIGTKELRDYMIISAYGLALIFGSEQAIILVNRIYPPFGLATISFFGLSSYLVLVGIYSSAISISQDSGLRQTIRNFALKETRLLDSIGTAHMEREIQKRVISLTKQNQERMAEESGIQASLTEEEMKAYVQQVLEEVKRDRDKQ